MPLHVIVISARVGRRSFSFNAFCFAEKLHVFYRLLVNVNALGNSRLSLILPLRP